MNTLFDPRGTSTQIVDQFIGEAYTTVRHVSENIEYVKHVSSNLQKIYTVSESLEGIESLLVNIDKVDLLFTNIDDILVVSNNVTELLAVASKLAIIINLHVNLPQLITNFDNINLRLAQFGSLEATIAATEAIRVATNTQGQAKVDAAEAIRVTALAQTTEQVALATAQRVLADADKIQTGLDRIQTNTDVIASGILKAQSEAARDGSYVAAQEYADETTGRGMVTDGATFLVRSTNPKVAAYKYVRDSSTVSRLIGSYPSASAVAEVSGVASNISNLLLERVGGGSIGSTTLTYPSPGIAQLQFSSTGISFAGIFPDITIPSDRDSAISMTLSSDPTHLGNGVMGLAIGLPGGDRLHFMYSYNGSIYTSPDTWAATSFEGIMPVWAAGNSINIYVRRRKDGSGFVTITAPDGKTKRTYRLGVGIIPAGAISFTGRVTGTGPAKLLVTNVNSIGAEKLDRDQLTTILPGDITSTLLGTPSITGLVAMHDLRDGLLLAGGRVREWGSNGGPVAKQNLVSKQPLRTSRGLIFNGSAMLAANQRSDIVTAEFVRAQILPVPPSGFGAPVCTGLTMDEYGIPIIINDGRANEGSSLYRPGFMRMSPDFTKVLSEVQLTPAFTPTVGSAQGGQYDISDGTIWVVDVANKKIRHLTMAGVELSDSITLAYTPNAIARNHAGDFLYVKQADNVLVEEISCATGAVLRSWSCTQTTDQMFYDETRKILFLTGGANGSNGKVYVWQPHAVHLLMIITNLRMSQAIEGIYVDGQRMLILNDGGFHTAANPALSTIIEYRIPLIDTQIISDEIMFAGIIGQLSAGTHAVLAINDPRGGSGGTAVYFSSTVDRIAILSKSQGISDLLNWSFNVPSGLTAEPFIFIAVIDKIGNTVKVYINGVELTAFSTSGTPNALVNPLYLSRYQIGAALAQNTGIATDYANMEARFIGLASSKTDRVALEGWLAWSDNRVDLLPIGHAHKTTPPVSL